MTALPAHLERVHMVGIGGAGMSGIARILLSRGGLVSGSDAKESRGVLALRARGAQVRIGHDADALDLLPGGPTVVVTTHAAIPKDNPELVEAARRGIPVILRPAVLASLMQGNRTFLVSGTHGKTSTTSMLVVALQHCGFDPSFAVGGELNEAGTNAHHGSGDVFVAEADESDGSLLQYDPNVIVVTNIEADHLDYFGSVEAYVKVFDDFVDKLRPGGLLIACLDDPGSADLAKRIVARAVRTSGYSVTDRQTRRKWRRAPPSSLSTVSRSESDYWASMRTTSGESCSSTWRARAPREPCGWQCRVVTWRSTHLRLYWLPVTPAPRRRRSSRGSPDSVAYTAGSSSPAASVVSGCSTTTPIIRPKFGRFSARRRIWFDRRTIRRRPIRQPDA